MKFNWQYQDKFFMYLSTFLREQGLSKNQLARLKFDGGKILVNGKPEHVDYQLHEGDQVEIHTAPEKPNDLIKPFEAPLDILYEDPHYLLVNKPPFVASLPSPQHPQDAMANRVKAHLINTHEESQAVHIVTRLDRDTSGIMMFAKHAYAHSRIDKVMQKGGIHKYYLALVSNRMENMHGLIDLPISRSTDFYMRRTTENGGKSSQTEYWVLENFRDAALVRLKLHTGRTHQIRVHFKAIGHPLIGDNLYQGPIMPGIARQALHCEELNFIEPFSQKNLTVKAPVPEDFKLILNRLN